jgi:hypothetical protein
MASSEFKNLRRHVVSQFLAFCGHDETAKKLRHVPFQLETQKTAWDKPNAVKNMVLDVGIQAARIVLSQYVEDLLSDYLETKKPKIGDGFMQWTLKNRISEPFDFIIQHMPLCSEMKWDIIKTELKYHGWDLDSAHCFLRFAEKQELSA